MHINKTAFVTGANKGIGFGICKHLGLDGWSIVIGARDEQRALEAIGQLKALGIEVLGWVRVELEDLDSIQEAAQIVAKHYPQVSLLVNNAGIPGDMSVLSHDSEIADVRQTIDVNYVGTFALTRALLPLITSNRGCIACITVPSEVSPYWHPMAYVASKAAQNAMVGVMAMEFEQNNTPVKIFSVHPGPTTTDLNGNMALPGFHTIDEVGQKFAQIFGNNQFKNGDFIELYPIVPE